MMNEGAVVRITKINVREDHEFIVAKFDYSIKMGDFILTVKDTALTKRQGMYGEAEYGLMVYSSCRTNDDGSKDYFPKSKLNPSLTEKLISEVKTALAFALKNNKKFLKLNELVSMYNGEELKATAIPSSTNKTVEELVAEQVAKVLAQMQTQPVEAPVEVAVAEEEAPF